MLHGVPQPGAPRDATCSGDTRASRCRAPPSSPTGLAQPGNSPTCELKGPHWSSVLCGRAADFGQCFAGGVLCPQGTGFNAHLLFAGFGLAVVSNDSSAQSLVRSFQRLSAWRSSNIRAWAVQDSNDTDDPAPTLARAVRCSCCLCAPK